MAKADSMSQLLPINFKYNERDRTLDVEWGDHSTVRYFDIHPNLAFLSPSNSRRGRDFIQFLQSNPVESEIIQEGSEMRQPETRPGLVTQQTGQQQTRLTYSSGVPSWGPKPAGSDGAA